MPTINKVIYDQDGFGERDHNLYGLLVLLQAPDVEPVGITTVSGREWSPRQGPRAREVLKRLRRPEVPVVGGAVFPLVNSPRRNARWEQVHGPLFDALCFSHDPDDLPSDHDPFWVPGEEVVACSEAARRVALSKAVPNPQDYLQLCKDVGLEGEEEERRKGDEKRGQETS